jgi:hypothetical protein
MMLDCDAHLLLKLLELLILLLPVLFNLLLCFASGVLYTFGAVLGVSERSCLRGGVVHYILVLHGPLAQLMHLTVWL